MACGTDDDLHAMVKGIVDELEAAVSGTLYDVDGDYKVIDDIDEWKRAKYAKKVEEFRKEHPEESYDPEEYGFDAYQEWMEDEIGTVDDVDEPDPVSLDKYIEKRGLGDTRFEVDTSMQLSAGRTLLAYGGPNIWVHDDEVRGYWGSSQCTMSLDSDTSSAMWDWFEQYWDVIKG